VGGGGGGGGGGEQDATSTPHTFRLPANEMGPRSGRWSASISPSCVPPTQQTQLTDEAPCLDTPCKFPKLEPWRTSIRKSRTQARAARTSSGGSRPLLGVCAYVCVCVSCVLACVCDRCDSFKPEPTSNFRGSRPGPPLPCHASGPFKLISCRKGVHGAHERRALGPGMGLQPQLRPLQTSHTHRRSRKPSRANLARSGPGSRPMESSQGTTAGPRSISQGRRTTLNSEHRSRWCDSQQTRRCEINGMYLGHMRVGGEHAGCVAHPWLPCCFQADLRELMRKAQAERAPRVDHPLAQYLQTGKLVCKLCQLPVASAATWPAHLASAAHVQVGTYGVGNWIVQRFPYLAARALRVLAWGWMWPGFHSTLTHTHTHTAAPRVWGAPSHARTHSPSPASQVPSLYVAMVRAWTLWSGELPQWDCVCEPGPMRASSFPRRRSPPLSRPAPSPPRRRPRPTCTPLSTHSHRICKH
jgi:hypothetical protein